MEAQQPFCPPLGNATPASNARAAMACSIPSVIASLPATAAPPASTGGSATLTGDRKKSESWLPSLLSRRLALLDQGSSASAFSLCHAPKSPDMFRKQGARLCALAVTAQPCTVNLCATEGLYLLLV